MVNDWVNVPKYEQVSKLMNTIYTTVITTAAFFFFFFNSLQ